MYLVIINMSLEFNSKIKGHYNDLSKSEKIIADYLLDNQSKIRNLSIQQLSAETKVSTSAISRFAKKIGFKNYREMIVDLAEATLDNPFFMSLDENDSMMNIARKTFYEGTVSLTSTISFLDEETLNRTIQLLAKSQKCFLFAMGGSSILAWNMYHRFIRTSLCCEYVEDFHMQLMNCGKLTSEDCAFIISHTGRNKDIMRAVEILQERHVPIICITSNALSPIAKKADIVLVSISEETKFRPEAVTSTISQMLLIDTLFTLYSIKVDHDHEYMKSIRQIINTTRF